MTFSHLLYAYVLGGLTFLPLVLAAVLLPAWWLAPRATRQDDSARRSSVSKPAEKSGSSADGDDAQELDEGGNGAASATFAVLRAYEFQAATAALNARTGSATSNREAGHDGSIETSESVYQTMYRSVFDRSKSAANPILDREEEPSPTAPTIKRKPVSVSVFYIVLRHGCLMLYDSIAQLEVRHVISLALHDVSLSEGDESEVLIDGDLFIKRTAIVLTPHASSLHQGQNGRSPPKPFYLFSVNCAEKEDFYHAMLASRTPPPVPQPIAPADAIKLQSTLHSSSLTPETRALNALLGRIFLALHRTPQMESLIRRKIERKMSRISKPSFIASLGLNAVDLGDAGPIISNLRLKDMNISGDTTIALDIRYNGAVKVVISAQAKIDLGSRFKTRTVDLVLASSLQRLHGHMLVRIKPPPSNRIWFCFESPPEMDIKVEPIVSQRQITYTFILRAIEERIRAVVAETLVKPNWDDVPFFDTRHQHLRGGIWKDEKVDDANELVDTEISASLLEKERNNSMPALSTHPDNNATESDGASTAASIASTSFDSSNSQLNRRSVSSLHIQGGRSDTDITSSTGLPRSLRSPSLTSPSPSLPSVSTEGATMSAAKPGEVNMQSRGWRLRAGQQLPSRRDAVEAVREMRDRAFMHLNAEGHHDTHADSGEQDGESVTPPSDDAAPGHRRTSSAASTSSTVDDLHDHPPPNRSATYASQASTLSRSQLQRKNLLAATAAATSAARNWSWNAISARGRGSNGNPESAQHATAKHQPMGRGQPLPPPGVPLPGPPKSLWASTGLGSVRRKPVPPLPPRSPARADPDSAMSDLEQLKDGLSSQAANEEPSPITPTSRTSEDEFGPWNENSGPRDLDVHDSVGADLDAASLDKEDHSAKEAGRTPPPLPARPASVTLSAGSPSFNAETCAYEHDDVGPDHMVLPSDPGTHDPSKASASEESFKGGQSINEEVIGADMSAHAEPDEHTDHSPVQEPRQDSTAAASVADSETGGLPIGSEVHGEDGVTARITDVVQEDEEELGAVGKAASLYPLSK